MAEHWTFQNAALPPGEPIAGKTYRADGWAYNDFPRCAPEYWDTMLEVMGAENYVALALADYGKTKRRQLLISPTGVDNLSRWIAEKSPRQSGESQ